MSAKILIAEDEEHLGHMIKFKLERAGYRVDWKMDGRQALDSIREERPDLVLLDIMMPGLTGFEVLDSIKRDEALRDIPVIMLTARNQESDIVRAIELGAADYMAKPFRPAELVARIRRLIPAAG